MSIDEKYAIVAFGNIKTRVETSNLERTNRKAERAMQQQQTVSNASAARGFDSDNSISSPTLTCAACMPTKPRKP